MTQGQASHEEAAEFLTLQISFLVRPYFSLMRAILGPILDTRQIITDLSFGWLGTNILIAVIE